MEDGQEEVALNGFGSSDKVLMRGTWEETIPQAHMVSTMQRQAAGSGPGHLPS